jgi:cytochrome b6-f complex iron-sulfur subunit
MRPSAGQWHLNFISQTSLSILSTMKVLSVVLALVAAASTAAFAPARMAATRSVVSTKMAAAEELYIDDQRRLIMNLIVVGSAAVSIGAFGIPYIAFFVPPGSGGGTGGTVAKDALGNEIFAKEYLETHPALDRNLAQGLKGDAT